MTDLLWLKDELWREPTRKAAIYVGSTLLQKIALHVDAREYFFLPLTTELFNDFMYRFDEKTPCDLEFRTEYEDGMYSGILASNVSVTFRDDISYRMEITFL